LLGEPALQPVIVASMARAANAWMIFIIFSFQGSKPS